MALNTRPLKKMLGDEGIGSPPTDESPNIIGLYVDTPEEGGHLVDLYGKPYFLNAKGVINGINESFWAGLFVKENIVLYEPGEKKFYLYEEASGLYRFVTEEMIFGKLSARILQASREWERPELEEFRSVNCVKGIVGRYLKAACETPNAFSKTGRNFMHLANAIIDFDTFELIPFSPRYRSKYASPISIVLGANWPRFESELPGPLDNEDKELIQKLFGQFSIAFFVIAWKALASPIGQLARQRMENNEKNTNRPRGTYDCGECERIYLERI